MSDKESPTVPPITNLTRMRGGNRHTATDAEIKALEESLLADLEHFDPTQANRGNEEPVLADRKLAGMMAFPDIVPEGTQHAPAPGRKATATTTEAPLFEASAGSLLDQLRHEADVQLQQTSQRLNARSEIQARLDAILKQVFFYLHDVVQQLNVLKPEIPRDYPISEQLVLRQLRWVEGFSDYRSLPQSEGGFVERVTLTARLAHPDNLTVERDGPTAERFRTVLFDYGLPFTCDEIRNERRYLEKCIFKIQSEVSINIRWRADFERNVIVLETRNLERLGGTQLVLRPEAVDSTLVDHFGRLLLGRPNQFRSLARRLPGG